MIGIVVYPMAQNVLRGSTLSLQPEGDKGPSKGLRTLHTMFIKCLEILKTIQSHLHGFIHVNPIHSKCGVEGEAKFN